MLYLVDRISGFGGADDVVSFKTRDMLQQCGLACECQYIWKSSLTRWLLRSRLRGRFWLSAALSIQWEWRQFVQRLRPGDVVWVCGSVSPKLETHCRFERAIQSQGAKYVLQLLDNTLGIPALQPATLARIHLADAVVVVTPALQPVVQQAAPEKPVVLLEEPVDTDRLYRPAVVEKAPVVIWTGHPRNTGHVTALAPILEKAFRARAFTLRLVCGSRRPALALNIPWEWYPYWPEREGDYFQTARAGIAFFEDTPYNRCKGNYKIKTMLAAGVPVITTPVGYNHILVKPGVTGFLARTPAEWVQSLETLMANSALASSMGAAARQDMVQRYSHSVLMPVWCAALSRLFPAQCKPEAPKDPRP